MKRQFWIMKCEPEIFSIDDLATAKEYFWDGVRNYQVRNMFRDEMKVGDKALFYHSSTKEIGVVGEMEVIKTATPDQTQFDTKSKYYDPKSTKENPRWLGPTVRFVSKLPKIVTLEQIKLNPSFSDLPLIKKGNRLSVMKITEEHYKMILKLSREKA